jgi:hypothetical protein
MTNKRKTKKKRGRLSRALFALSLVFLIGGLVLLGWGVWPPPTDAVQVKVPAGVLPGAPCGTTYASMADYVLSVSWPVWMRAGEEGTLQVLLVEEDADSSGLGNRPAQIVLVEPAIIGLAVDPGGRMQANLAAGQDLDLTWTLESTRAGAYEGKVYAAFGFYDEEQDKLVSVPVAVVDVAFEVKSLWGLEGRMAMWFGLVGVALWGALFVLGRVAQGRE